MKRIEASKRAAAPFVSHCAPDSDAANALDPSKLTVARLKEALDEWDAWPSHLRRSGARKADLVSAVREARAKKANAVGDPGRNFSPPPPGTAHLEARMNSPEAAAAEKIAAGEKGNVEHVALGDDASAAVCADAKAGKAGASRRSRPRATETPAKKRRGTTHPGAASAARRAWRCERSEPT